MMKKTFILSLIILCFAISRKSSAQCPYNNILYISGAAPATVGQVLVAPDTWAGEYNRITGCVAGYTYRISTCSTLTFDSELTVYPAGGGTPIAYNDDFCSLSSELTFVAPSNGSYDLLLDEIGCFDNQIDMDMEIELVSTGTGNPGAPNLTIPVVVHVVYKTTAQNISNAQIQSQIDILNEDFRKQNADQSMVPSIWQSLHADFEIEFCLATEDPSGSPTTGITRTVTSANSFSFGTDMKSNSTGGKNNWNPQKYLNIWVCNLSGGLLGFATFPDNLASNPSSDGVVIDYQYFGDIGSATNPFDLGRTATHEIGHWLNLRHIWGDSNCGSDFVNDTPTQQSSNSNCPSFPSTSSCTGNPPNGDMFMNFMDYVDDDCMHMFTEGQKARSESALLLYRSQLFTSTGCGVSTGVQTNEELNFVNIFPNPNEGTFTVSIDNMSEDIIQLELFNSIGQMVKQIDIVASLNNAIDIDLSKHNAGVYYVRIANENVNTTKKIIVN